KIASPIPTKGEHNPSILFLFSESFSDPRRFKLVRETTFGRRHLKFWSDHSLLLWPVCFLRQLAGSVSKADYFALRRGFIMAHFGEEDNFDFHKFLRRSLDADFVKVVGMRLWIWVASTLFIFFQAHAFHNYLWLPFVPLLILLMAGTKLEVIITKMCLESSGLAVVSGTLLVKPHNQLFWFGRPQWLLHLIHLVLFQYKFGLRSCFHRRTEDIVIRIAMGILVHLLCGYVTLPLYALVTQMGSSMNTAVFTEGVARGLKNWHKTAKQKTTRKLSDSASPSTRLSAAYPTEINLPATPSLLTVGTSLSDDHGTTSPELDGTSVQLKHVKEIATPEEETDTDNANPKESYNGEFSFKC
ncbi:hypothetical protein Taro_036591, partial [Colocasia esculenta]|nr:hypothetical protein [Colocasia esculenta]